jgi:HrpA-like RNA helicase
MREYGGDVDYEGIPINSLRNLPVSHFIPELHISEDETNRRPSAAPINEFVELVYAQPTDADWEALAKPEIVELGNETLPVWDKRHEIAAAVRENSFTLIFAETGAGKTTQVPQILLNEGFKRIIVTQPRIAAARNIYDRIKIEIADKLGQERAEEIVSYRTAPERAGPDNASIEIVTDGLSFARDAHLGAFNENVVIVIDEVHEKNINIEMLMAIANESAKRGIKVHYVLMSATIDADRISDYFAKHCDKRPPIIEVPGRTFPVDKYERPDSDIIAETVKASELIHLELAQNPEAQNAIQVFVAGKREIDDTIDGIRKKLPPEIAKDAKIFPLHSKLTQAEQQAAMQRYPGVNIIVSTNMGQTSLTIPHNKYVIDSGEHRRMEIDREGVQCLMLGPVSQADCDQRAGRVGRVSKGTYVLTRPNSKVSFVSYDRRDKFPTAEILRTDIVRSVLRIASYDLNIANFELLHPVDPAHISRSQEVLRVLGALDDNDVITEIGHQMNSYPVCATSAKMMVEVGTYPQAVRDYMSVMAAAKETGGLQYFSYDAGKRWQSLTNETSSDMLTQLDIFIATQSMDDQGLKDHDLDIKNVERAREQYHRIARKAGALGGELLPPTLEEREQLKLCIYAGMINTIFLRNEDGGYIQVGKPDSPERQISNRSNVRDQPSALVGDPYRVEFFRDGERGERHTIEHGTATTLAAMGRAAVHLTKWKSSDLTLRGGTFVDVQRQSLFGVDLGTTRERHAVPSPRLRHAVIEHALNNPGKQQKQLRELKKKLETLGHMSRFDVPQITQDRLEELLAQAAPDDVTSPEVVDVNLRRIMAEQKISLANFVSLDEQQAIIAAAPKQIECAGVSMTIQYRNGHPFIKVSESNAAYLAALDDEALHLPDGREIFFIYGKSKNDQEHGRKHTLSQLKRSIYDQTRAFAPA